MGIEVVHFEIFPLALTDYSSLLLKVKRQIPTFSWWDRSLRMRSG